MSTIPVMQLTAANLPALRRHFLALPSDDVRLRFGLMLPPESVLRYVNGIDFARDVVYGVFDGRLELDGVAHLGLIDDIAEFGVSVLPGQRRRGIGSALFQRAAAYARNHGLSTFFMHCLAENAAMARLARRAGMKIVTQGGEADAHLSLPPASPATIASELLHDRLALFDFALKSQVAAARALMAGVTDAARKLREPDAG